MDEFGIVCVLPEGAGTYHRTLHRKIEEKFNLTGDTELKAPSHITLKYRFQAEAIHEVEQVLQTFSTTQPVTKWSLQGFNYFTNAGNYVIFIDVLPASDVRTAHARLLEDLRRLPWMQWGPFDDANLHYHVTLAHTGLTSENFERVWAFIHQHEVPNFSLSFDNLALLQINEERHTVYKQYWLSDNCDT